MRHVSAGRALRQDVALETGRSSISLRAMGQQRAVVEADPHGKMVEGHPLLLRRALVHALHHEHVRLSTISARMGGGKRHHSRPPGRRMNKILGPRLLVLAQLNKRKDWPTCVSGLPCGWESMRSVRRFTSRIRVAFVRSSVSLLA